MKPAVSVVMAARDAEAFLDEAMQSILRQDFRDMEVVVVDDGSEDRTSDILSAHAAGDDRVRVLRENSSRGLAAALNRAIAFSTGDLLVRMDADDVAEPFRVSRLMAHLRDRPDVVIVGSNVTLMDRQGRVTGESDLPIGDVAIRATCLIENPFVHPAVAMRAWPFRQGLCYDESFDTTQDWELWTRLLEYGAGSNLSGSLLRFRSHPGSVSATRRERQRANSTLIVQRQFARVLGVELMEAHRIRLLLDGFLQGRAEADAAGVDRIAACEEALWMLDRFCTRFQGSRLAEIRWRIVARAIRMGLVPPMRAGWPGLVSHLVLRHPLVTAVSAMNLLFRGHGRAV